MTRRATYQDIPALIAMLREMLAASKYAGRGEIAEKAADNLLTTAIASQNHRGPQGSHVVIAEHNGEPVGFMVGVLDRVYSVGNKLTANDLFLYVRPGAPPRTVIDLLDSYLEWASGIRAVIEIMLSYSDALPGAERIAPLYERMGFKESGRMYERRLDVPQEQAA